MSDQTVKTLKQMLAAYDQIVDPSMPANFQAALIRAREQEVAALTSALAALEARTWRPIETAPKDERTWLLVLVRGTHRIVQWDRRVGWLMVPGMWGCKPTHWQPLPPLPVSPDAAERTT